MHPVNPELVSKPTHAPFRYDFFLVGIGFSNGGIEPLKTIVAKLPADICAAIVVISNGIWDASDKVTKILQDVTTLPVIDVDKQVQLRSGQIYVVPPDHHVSVHNAILGVQQDLRRRRTSRVIDTCFRSLAYEGREKTICVILSGLGYDGLQGAITVESHGGLVIAQDPATARAPMMPVAVIANDDPSFVLGPDEIGEIIVGQLGR